MDLISQNKKKEKFFEIQDDLFILRPNYLNTRLGALGESTTPIVFKYDNEERFVPLGTGFFISCNGLLITAAHVIYDILSNKKNSQRKINMGIMIPRNRTSNPDNEYIYFPFEWVSLLEEEIDNPLIGAPDGKIAVDTAVCKVTNFNNQYVHQPLNVIQSGIKGISTNVGKEVFAVGYGDLNEVEFITREKGVYECNKFLPMHVSIGQVIEKYENNLREKSVSTPGPCFSFEAKLPAGMSGSPIFDSEGIYTYGHTAKELSSFNNSNELSFGVMLWNSLKRPISRLNNKTISEIMSEPQFGFPLISAPDI